MFTSLVFAIVVADMCGLEFLWTSDCKFCSFFLSLFSFSFFVFVVSSSGPFPDLDRCWSKVVPSPSPSPTWAPGRIPEGYSLLPSLGKPYIPRITDTIPTTISYFLHTRHATYPPYPSLEPIHTHTHTHTHSHTRPTDLPNTSTPTSRHRRLPRLPRAHRQHRRRRPPRGRRRLGPGRAQRGRLGGRQAVLHHLLVRALPVPVAAGLRRRERLPERARRRVPAERAPPHPGGLVQPDHFRKENGEFLSSYVGSGTRSSLS